MVVAGRGRIDGVRMASDESGPVVLPESGRIDGIVDGDQWISAGRVGSLGELKNRKNVLPLDLK